MADSKKYDGSQWEHSLRKQTTASEIIVPPTTIYADGTAISTYTIKGNTVQNGTPTPSNPVAVNGVGERTGNLLQIPDVAETTKRGVTYHIKGNSLYIDGTSTTAFGFNIRGTFTLKAGTYTNQMYGFTGNRMYYSFDNVPATMCTSDVNLYKTFTISEDTTYVNALVWINNGVAFNNEKIDFALFESEVPKEFEVYGYKIPISTAQGSAVNYLGSVQSTRQIKKLVLTGQENITKESGNAPFRIPTPQLMTPSESQILWLCTHYQSVPNSASWLAYDNMISWSTVDTGYKSLRIRDIDYNSSSIDTYKSYLQQQYQNGTPVVIYYVLDSATTGIVNEPLMKIGNYADSISDATPIPTTDGANSITVDATVQPSEFTATWTGWHDSQVKEYDGTDWQ